MLKVLLLALMVGSVAQASVDASQASELPKRCKATAEKAMQTVEKIDRYDVGGISAYECAKSPVGRAVICNVYAEKGDGAAVDSYQVILNASCSRAFRVELTGEE